MDSLSLDTCLEKLKCSICNRLLSVFPIYTMKVGKDNGLLSICGRCEVPDIENSLRCEIFENLAKIIKFPCIYRENGCMENLLPEHMKQHELICFYRFETCVFRQQNNCEWNGCFSQLLQHCEVEHEDLFLKDYQFEFDLCEDHCLTNILLYWFELFLFKRSFKQESNQLICSLRPLGYYKDTVKYYGQINLTTTDTTISKMFPEIKINGNDSKSINIYVHNMLNEIDTKVIGIIKIANSIEQLNSICDTKNDRELSRLLKCFVCKKSNIVYYCNLGHYVCEICKNKCCSRSAVVMQDTRILRLVSLKCSYCSFRGNTSQLNSHNSHCFYKPIDCVYKNIFRETGNKCMWNGRKVNLLQHFIENHKQDMIKLNETIKLNIVWSDKMTTIYDKYFHYGGYLFQLTTEAGDSKLFIYIRAIVQCRQFGEFEFEIVLGHSKYQSLKVNFKKSCSNLQDCQMFSKNQVGSLMSGETLNFKINVS